MTVGPASPSSSRPNYIYYFEVGVGQWTGRFDFHLTSWRSFWSDPIGPKYRLITLWLWAVLRLLGPVPILSELKGDLDAGEGGVMANSVKIAKWGLPLYELHEHYYLDPDGVNVRVDAHEQFGPIPYLLNDHKIHGARVESGGLRAVYDLPLLGTKWVATYQVADDRRHIHSDMKCAWAEAHETIERTGLENRTPGR